jgi:hypothetical protein
MRDTRDIHPPIAKLNSAAYEGTVTIEVIATEDVDGMQIKNAIDEELNAAFRYIHYQSAQLEPFNSSLLERATTMVEERRNRILRIRQIPQAEDVPHPQHLPERNGCNRTVARRLRRA